MKLIKISFLFAFFLATYYTLPAQWHPQESGTEENLYDVFCLNADTVFAVGANGTILKTSDGGENWTLKEVEIADTLYKVRFASDNIGYTVGSSGKILKTTDCGETWTELITNTDKNIHSISCLTEETVYVSGDDGLIMKTEDGGVNWTQQVSGTSDLITNIQFLNDSVGYASPDNMNWAFEETFLKTNDGGENWIPLEVEGSGHRKVMYFWNDTTGYIGTGEFLIKTTNGGESWVDPLNHVFHIDSYFNSLSVIVPDDEIWVNTCVDYLYYTRVFKFENNLSYDTETVWTGKRVIYFVSDTLGYMVGYYGRISKNIGGENIKAIDTSAIISTEISEKPVFYPNPTSDVINISFPKNLHMEFDLSICDITGKSIYNKTTYTHSNMKIDLSFLQKGIYFIFLRNKKYFFSHKVFIN